MDKPIIVVLNFPKYWLFLPSLHVGHLQCNFENFLHKQRFDVSIPKDRKWQNLMVVEF